MIGRALQRPAAWAAVALAHYVLRDVVWHGVALMVDAARTLRGRRRGR